MGIREDNVVVLGWFSDFVHALLERPLWARLLFRVVVGRYAYSEFLGALDEMQRRHCYPYNIGYGLEDGDWHKRPIRWDWWREPTEQELEIRQAQQG